jgi:hypothetical protein
MSDYERMSREELVAAARSLEADLALQRGLTALGRRPKKMGPKRGPKQGRDGTNFGINCNSRVPGRL